MKDGFVKVAALSPKGRVADCKYNADVICQAIRKAADEGARLIVFPELSVSGYTCSDLFWQASLLDAVKQAIVQIADFCKDIDSLVIFGAPLVSGANLYNCAIVVKSGEILAAVPKKYLPNYCEFYEGRHFSSGKDVTCEIVRIGEHEVKLMSDVVFCCNQLADFCVGVEICEDLWVNESPYQRLCACGATIICNLSASDETIGKSDYRRLLVSSASGKGMCAYIYCDASNGESTTDLVFSGHNIIAENGTILAQSLPFESAEAVTEVDVCRLVQERVKHNTFDSASCQKIYFDMQPKDCLLTRKFAPNPFVPQNENELNLRSKCIFDIQTHALAKRIEHIGCKSLVVGVSGGLDSALAVLVASRAAQIVGLDPSCVVAITMPCFGTTTRTRSNAEKLALGLGAHFECIDIKRAVEVHLEDIAHSKDLHDITYENAQARERTQVLMDWANKSGGIVIGTGDLSELALGWATYNGDHMSMYAVNASLPKTLIRHVVRYCADCVVDDETSKVLYDILATPVSPELLPAKDGKISQKTEELVGPYELHDFFIYYAVRHGFAPSKIYRIALLAFEDRFDADTIYHWLQVFYKRFFAQQFKRSCLPDGPKVGTVDFSPRGGWRMPSDACARAWLDDLEKIKK